MSLRDEILAYDDLPIEPVTVPEWKGRTVYVRTLTGTERDAFEASNRKGKGKDVQANLANFRARFAVLVCCDEKGQRIFADSDAAALGRKSAAALDRIVTVGFKLNGMSEEAEAEAEGNSESGQS